MRRLHPSGFATLTQHFVSLVALHFAHFHTNAAESNAPYFIQGCKYYINCSRPISARSMPQTELLLGFIPSPASHSVLRQPQDFIKTGWGHTRLSDIWALTPNPVLSGVLPRLWSSTTVCYLWTIELQDSLPSAGMQNQPGKHSCGAESLFETAHLKCNDILVSSDPLSVQRVPP